MRRAAASVKEGKAASAPRRHAGLAIAAPDYGIEFVDRVMKGDPIQRALAKNKLNVIGENHDESNPRREREKECLKQLIEIESDEYWEEDEFEYDKDDPGGRPASRVYGDPIALRIPYLLATLRDTHLPALTASLEKLVEPGGQPASAGEVKAGGQPPSAGKVKPAGQPVSPQQDAVTKAGQVSEAALHILRELRRTRPEQEGGTPESRGTYVLQTTGPAVSAGLDSGMERLKQFVTRVRGVLEYKQRPPDLKQQIQQAYFEGAGEHKKYLANMKMAPWPEAKPGAYADLPTAEATSTLRSKAMAVAASRSRDKKGAWKVGNNHAKDMQEFNRAPGAEDPGYEITTREQFDIALTAFEHDTDAADAGGDQQTASDDDS
jgi:hypothetical protein